ncbi:hypothetical protein AncyloWKF20_07605 [Ancylobacter sp. WKF20]|uniref:hypothetical protein n=1 Tax=Ancylobacter sp. WKF20 TaxID=3039801 RepID=UPI00243458C9|nr:hypothetical protein [Ancylobacter sp. WKF20]WGD31675.1 hypothetical protein AncyloWKF20_07605 [Ancylobacter sp. WKF20]
MAIDTNLLLLFVVGVTNKNYIQLHKRLNAFFDGDYELLLKAIRGYKAIVLTPNVVSETSNLIRMTSEPRSSEIANRFEVLIKNTPEVYISSASASSRREHARLGITDCGLIELSAEGAHILTTDYDLFHAVSACGFTAVNFNHLREAAARAR